MNDLTKTSVFIGAALLAAAGSIGVYYATQPTVRSIGADKVHQEFFEEFDVNEVRSMKITAIDAGTQKPREFEVAFKDGLWRIPSHHNYPAESADMLFKTASMLMGLEREALVGQKTNDHNRLGVVDPTSQDEDLDPAETGTRITLRDVNDNVLADLIVGHENKDVKLGKSDDVFAERTSQDKYYYVRLEDETPTYLTRFDLDLSTRFSDWIEPDLLKLEPADIDEILIDNYSLQSQNVLSGGRLVKQIGKIVGDQHWLRRDDQDAWQLEGLDPIQEELETTKVDEIVSLLDEMTIVGVRPKTQLKGKPLIKPDLSINLEELQSVGVTPSELQQAIYTLQDELDVYGFNIMPVEGRENEHEILAARGQMKVTTGNGIVYNLYFGDLFDGDESEIEIGASEENREAPNSADAAVKSAAGEDSEKAAADDPSTVQDSDVQTAQGKSRYLMVSVQFDDQKLAKPVEPSEPVEPVKPEGYVPKEEAPEKSGDDAESESGDQPPAIPDAPQSADDSGDAEAKKEDIDKQDYRDPAFIKYDEDLAAYTLAKQDYTIQKGRYTTELQSYNESLKSAELRVKELNERFGPWFYVISAGDLKSLKIQRVDLVKAREVDPNAPTLPRRPDITVPDPMGAPQEKVTQPPEAELEKKDENPEKNGG